MPDDTTTIEIEGRPITVFLVAAELYDALSEVVGPDGHPALEKHAEKARVYRNIATRWGELVDTG